MNARNQRYNKGNGYVASGLPSREHWRISRGVIGSPFPARGVLGGLPAPVEYVYSGYRST